MNQSREASHLFMKRAPRFSLSSQLTVIRSGVELYCYSLNISRTGLLFKSHQRLNIGDFLILNLSTTLNEFQKVNFGIVVRKVENSQDFQYGLCFIDHPPLDQYVDATFENSFDPTILSTTI